MTPLRAIAICVALGVAACQPTIDVDGHPVSCGSVDNDTCLAVATLAINNLGRDSATGTIMVFHRPSCPPVPDWADSSNCWQVMLPTGSDATCMVIARRPTLGGYGQVAGDEPGLATKPGHQAGCPA